MSAIKLAPKGSIYNNYKNIAMKTNTSKIRSKTDTKKFCTNAPTSSVTFLIKSAELLFKWKKKFLYK